VVVYTAYLAASSKKLSSVTKPAQTVADKAKKKKKQGCLLYF